MTDPTPLPPRRRVTHREGGRVRVKQADAPETDINVIMARWRESGLAPPVREDGVFGDFSNGADYQTSLDQLIAMRELFDAQTAAVRNFCANDPAIFLDAVADPDTRVELAKLGLVIEGERIVAREVAPDAEPEGPAKEAEVQGASVESGDVKAKEEAPSSP